MHPTLVRPPVNTVLHRQAVTSVVTALPPPLHCCLTSVMGLCVCVCVCVCVNYLCMSPLNCLLMGLAELAIGVHDVCVFE